MFLKGKHSKCNVFKRKTFVVECFGKENNRSGNRVNKPLGSTALLSLEGLGGPTEYKLVIVVEA